MSEIIIPKWKLAVLRATLDLSQKSPHVRVSLHGFPESEEVEYWVHSYRLEDFGIPASGENPRDIRVPEELAPLIDRTMGDQLDHETALWLRLEPPYGYLGAAPWEDLGTQIGVPVLRVPDRLPVSTRLGKVWRVALVTSALEDPAWAADHVRGFTNALLLRASWIPVEVDVFADAHVAAALDSGEPLDSRVRLHDASAPPRRHRAALPRMGPGLRAIESESDPRLAWLDWITQGVAHEATSALHIAAAGIASVDHSMLSIVARPSGVADRPSKAATRATAAAVDAEDLWALADTLGASLVSIAAPEADGPDVGARMVADRLGQLRPGPTIFSSIRADDTSEELAQIHEFFATSGDRRLPTNPSWFGYIQPESVRDALDSPSLAAESAVPSEQTTVLTGMLLGPEPTSSVAGEDPWAGAYADSMDVPRWVASSSRFLETRQANALSALTDDLGSDTVKQAYDSGASKALADIQALVEKHVGGTK